jgi:hypothetical protein
MHDASCFLMLETLPVHALMNERHSFLSAAKPAQHDCQAALRCALDKLAASLRNDIQTLRQVL